MTINQKLRTISDLSYKTAEEITSNKEKWTSYLDTAARLYKYSFPDQLLIHAQRPDAIACATFDLWNNTMRRWIKQGSKGIALIDKSEGKPRLKYVFDVADTRDGSGKSRSPNLWELKREHEKPVLDALSKTYGSFGRELETQLKGIAEYLVNENFMEYKNDLMYHKNEGALEKLEESKMDAALKEALTTSITYTLMSRCGLDTKKYFSDENFLSIRYFNSFESAMMLGSAVSELSEQVLRQIEKTIKFYEIVNLQNHGHKDVERRNERDNLFSKRGLSDPRPDVERGGRLSDREIWNAAGNISERAPVDTLQQTSLVGEVDQPSAGSRRNGYHESGADHPRNAKKRTRTGQSNGSNGMGAAHEWPEGDGRGNRSEGVGLQLSLFPTQQEQIEKIKKDISPVVSIQQEETDLWGKNEPESHLAQVEAEEYLEKLPNKYNFHITNDDLGVGGAKTKYSYNVSVIRTLKKIEAEERLATPEEQEILTKYVGWGSLPQAFDKENKNWEKEYIELKNLLSDDEYSSARASTLNAHYTSPTVIKAIYDAVERMGFQSGNILEPACGIGNFLGLLPENMEKSKLYGVELDSITGRIAKQLYQNADITVSGFEKINFPNSFFDLAIGNVPFGSYKVMDKKYDKHNFLIHDYFFAKTLENVRSGGVIAFITSKGTLDKQNPEFRKYIAQRADFLGAIRLPNNAFLSNAGTEVTSDIIFLKKRDRLIDIQPDWIHLSKTEDGVPINSYFADNPHMVLGKMIYDESMYGNQKDTACIPYAKTDELTFEQQTEQKFKAFREKFVQEEKQNTFIHRIEKSILEQENYNLSFFSKGDYKMSGGLTYIDKMFGGNLTPFLKSLVETEIQADKSQKPLSELLKEAVNYLPKDVFLNKTHEEFDVTDAGDKESIMADPSVRNFSYAIVDENVYYRENSRMVKQELSEVNKDRLKGLVLLRDCVRELIHYQLEEYSDYEIKQKQVELNALYDSFTEKHGLINSRVNNKIFSNDSAYFLLCSLEILDENGQLERKADMFTKRTIKRKTVVTSVDTASEALALSISEKAAVDINYMCGLTGFSEEKLINDLKGVIFRNPQNTDSQGNARFETADEYLSGNVRQKLNIARQFAKTQPELYAQNATVLEVAQPKDLTASEIDVRLGSTWIDKQYVQDFMFNLLETPISKRYSISVEYSPLTSGWSIKGKNVDDSVLANYTYGTDRMNAYRIIEETLNLKDALIYDTIRNPDGSERRVLNKKETILAQQKQESIKQAFRDWVFKDPKRRETLVRKYNEEFNSIRPREYDGSHIDFSGINPEINLRSYQRNAIAHILYGGNTLLAHEVGAGKTFEMIAAAMESKRLGLAQKSMFVVPNHLTEQIASDFLRLYHSANILVATKKDFETQNRKKFCSRIATGDYDAVIIGHSQFERIPMSKERQERMLKEQVEELTEGIEELKRNKGERFTVKQLEKTKRSLEARLDKLNNTERKDDVVTFEELGIDKLFVDEAHNFKNLFLATKMRNVAGISQTEAQKSSDLFIKCRYLDELTGGKGIVFATGTPISNSMTELYTMMRYLQYDTLQKHSLGNFDAWASTFGETVTSNELAPEGSGYRSKTRFAKFYNLPELMNLFKEAADIKTADMLNLPTPKANYHTIAVQPTEHQRELVAGLSERAAAVHRGAVDSSKDNMLKITGDGRKIGLDQRLMNSMLPDDENSKVNTCMQNIYRIWDETKAKKLTQLVFCDISTPHNDGQFNIYDDIKSKLVAKGVPLAEIAFIHNADTETKKKELFAKMRKGQIRILIGSTAKLGAGTNIQDKLIALHDVDCPWRPADLEQRAGRIVRYGNKNPEVDIYRYVTESTFDSYLYQTLENKQRFISQIMTSKSPVRSCDDIDEATLSYAEVKALCAGNPQIKEKMDLDIQVAKLRVLKANHQSQQYILEDKLLKDFPKSIEKAKERVESLEEDNVHLKEYNLKNREQFPSMVIEGIPHANKEEAGNALLDACKSITGSESINVGEYCGFDMRLSFDHFKGEYELNLKRNMSYSVMLGKDAIGNITRINNALEGISSCLDEVNSRLDTLYHQVDNAKAELAKPFPFELELAEKSARLIELDSLLNMDQGQTEIGENAADSHLDSQGGLTNAPSERKTKMPNSTIMRGEENMSLAEKVKMNQAKIKEMAATTNGSRPDQSSNRSAAGL